MSYLTKLTKQQKKIYEQNLLRQNKCICTGKLCKGKIRSLDSFSYSYNKCDQCRAEVVYSHNDIVLKLNCIRVTYDRQNHKDMDNTWEKIISNHHHM